MRRVRKKGGNKEKVFGCDLLEHLTASSQEIPQVLRCCSEFVEQHGIVDGIYRLSGVSSNIQKLRSEFESDGSPDLNKDVYLQDIHCVSSLCKAYFRELPNPLLTYQLYDKFAEAVAIQLEEERLVKIRDVLKELSAPHYRTLEFLMRHLVKMASFSSETNMHARNLAIVWAPNLLRSKDIETSGFNGTAAFMEVRVQSIVVEFILTHVPQLFPGIDVLSQRRKSLPSPSAVSNQDEAFTLPVQNFGNISPGDGPLPIRPYHAIIEGTDKRKGSLKGRKWMSIFNIGGRFHDQRRRHKHSAKEKDRPALRPARSMDSLSTSPYSNEGSRRPAKCPPSTQASPVVTPAAQPGPEITASTGVIGCSEYAVTYRRGTGLVSGGAGTQGTYTALDREGSAANETVQTRSPGLSKVGRRAAMHITGPITVTVPLHITPKLALGVLQGGGGDRVIFRGRVMEGGDRVEGKVEGEKTEKKKSKVIAKKVEEGRKSEEEMNSSEEKNSVEVQDNKSNKLSEDETGEVKGSEEKEDQMRSDSKQPPTIRVQSVSEEQQPKSCTSNTEEDLAEDSDITIDDDHDYMAMEGGTPAPPQPVTVQQGDDRVVEASDFLNSTDAYDPELSGYVQDNFDFLDQMDCSVLDHLDCSGSYQVNEFSVEPPGHSDDEYEIMEPEPARHHPAEAQTHLQAGPETQSRTQSELQPHRPLSLDLNSRHTKSLSLPHMISPVHGAEESGSEEESEGDDSGDLDSSCEEEDFFLSAPSGSKPDAQDTRDSCTPVHHLQSSEETVSQSPTSELSECVEPTEGDGDREDEGGLEEQEMTKEKEEDEVSQEQEELENNLQRRATGEDLSTIHNPQTIRCLTPEATSHDSVEASFAADMKTEEKEEFEAQRSDCKPHPTLSPAQPEATDAPSEESRDPDVTTVEHPESCDSEDSTDGDSEGTQDKEADCTGQQFHGIKEGDKSMCEEPRETNSEGTADESHGSSEEQFSAAGLDIWEELEEVVCEVIEYEESQRSERGGAAGQTGVGEDGEAEQAGELSGETLVQADKNKESKTEVRLEIEGKSLEENERKPREPEVQDEFLQDEIHLPRMSVSEKATQEEHAFFRETQNHSGAEVDTKQPEKENKERQTPTSLGEGPNDAASDVRGFREGRKKSPSSLKGVGRKLVVSKNPKVYQVKAVPVVPPKPQHCKITALNLRQQQQQQQHRERTDAGRGREKTQEVPADRDGACAEHAGVDDSTERKVVREGGDKERDRRRDGAEAAVRDSSRNSPLSMCFDEAVAIATMRRERERREGEGEAEGTGK